MSRHDDVYTFTRGLFVSAYRFVTSSGANPVAVDDDLPTSAPN